LKIVTDRIIIRWYKPIVLRYIGNLKRAKGYPAIEIETCKKVVCYEKRVRLVSVFEVDG